MSFGQRSPRKQGTQVNLLFLVVGVFIGFLASSFLSMASHEPQSYSGKSLNNAALSSPPTSNNINALPFRASRKSEQSDNDIDDNNDNGWSLIHVYYGNAKHLPDTSAIQKDYFQQAKWFSQVRQDEVVSTLFQGKRDGYFVDLAANDAVRISNTYALETNFGWRGICLEPNPMYWPSLAYRKCDVVAAVVGQKSMEEIQFKYPNRAGPQGGIVGKDFDNKEASKFGEDHPRYTATLLDIFERFDTPNVIDYLSLDIEGAEDLVMQGFPFERYRINVLTVERPSDELRSLLEQHDYILLKQLKRWGETVWIHRRAESLLNKSALNIDTENYKYREKAIS
jgi:hypothetical protein